MEHSDHIRAAHRNEWIGTNLLRLITLITAVPVIGVILYILARGMPAISLEFLTQMPRDGMRAGGIFPAIIGTIYLTLGTAVFSVPLGVAAGIYIAEYASDIWVTRLIRITIINLAGIPSVVYGLFGVFAHSALPAIALLVALLGIFLAYAIYGKKWISAENIGRTFKPLYNLFYRKYFLDELYQDIIVKKILLGGIFAGLQKVDSYGVDGAVNGVAKATAASGRAATARRSTTIPSTRPTSWWRKAFSMIHR